MARIRPNYLLRIYGFAACAPAFVLFTFGALILRARIGLGRWPTPYVDVPGADVYFYDWAVVLCVLWFVLSPWLMLTLHPRLQKRDRTSRTYRCAGLCWVISTAVLVWLVIADPGRVVEWFMD